MSYLVLAYPSLSSKDYELIQSYRKNHDALLYSVIEPHFTFVFPVYNMVQEEFVKEVTDRSAGFSKFDFVIRCATVSKDGFNDFYHTFLVPDEGYSNIVKLHDKLYSGKLQSDLRLDIDFIPHMGLGKSKDKWHCKNIAGQWNEKENFLEGSIHTLAVVKYENNKVIKLKEIELRSIETEGRYR